MGLLPICRLVRYFDGSADEKIILSGTNTPYIQFQEGSTDKAFIQWNVAGFLEIYNQETDESIKIASGTNGLIFHAGGADRVVYHTANLSVGDGGLTQNNFTNTLKSKLDGIAASATNVTNNNQLTNGAGYITSANATGGSSDKIFWENGQTITANYTVGTTFGAACNAMSTGPISINSSITVTIDSGDTWTII